MGWAEARTRIGQEAAKHLDLAAYRFGGRRSVLGPLTLASGGSTYFLGSSAKEIASRASLLRQHLPEEVENIIGQADKSCRHEFDLLGYESLDYGREINWHFDPVHGKQSPLKPWFTINFLDLHEVGDHKIIWELNRHQHLVTLAKAWRLTEKQLYAKELLDQWNSWHKSNPYPLGINWASALEVAFRSLSWLWVRDLLAGCPELPSEFEKELLLSLQGHGRYIERYLSTYFSPNTHLLGEAVALLFLGILCPQIPYAQRWQDKGWTILLNESRRQVRADGVYFEQALYYHVYALDFFLHARRLAGQTGLSIPEEFDTAVQRMLAVVDALSEIGSPEGFGDDDGGRLFNPRRNRLEHLTDPLALGSILYPEKYAAATLTEEAIWLFGKKATDTLESPPLPKTSESRAFEAGGIYLINDAAPCAQQMMIDAGPQGTGRSGHGHADALSVRLSIDERRFLVDPGTFCYVGGQRDLFRGTAAHNTLRIDGLDQAVPEGPFAWSNIPNVKAEKWVTGSTFDLFVGSHDGYQRLSSPVLHRRCVFHAKAGLWFICDLAEGRDKHLLESFWHFAPDLRVGQKQGAFLVGSAANPERDRTALLFAQSSDWKTEIEQRLVSGSYGSQETASIIRASIDCELPQECAVLLLPRIQANEVGTFAAIDDCSLKSVRGYRYKSSSSTEYVFLAQRGISWTCGDWTCDAGFLYCKQRAGRFSHVIMVSGSFAQWRGRRFLSHPSIVDVFEWSNVHELGQSAFKGGRCLTKDFDIDFELFDLVP
jgi:hypothetical protein